MPILFSHHNETKQINILTRKLTGWLKHNKKEFEQIFNKHDKDVHLLHINKIIKVNLKNLKLSHHSIYIEITVEWNEIPIKGDLLTYIKNKSKLLRNFQRLLSLLEVLPHNVHYSLTELYSRKN